MTVYRLIVLPDSKRVLTLTVGGHISLWRIDRSYRYPEGGGDLPTVDFGRDRRATYSMDLSPDGKRLLAGCAGGELRYWDVESGEEIERFAEPAHLWVGFGAGGRQAIATDGKEVRVWDLGRRTWTAEFAGPETTETTPLVAFAVGGDRLLITSTDGKTATEYFLERAGRDSPAYPIRPRVAAPRMRVGAVLAGHAEGIRHLSYFDGGRKAITVAESTKVCDVATGDCLKTLPAGLPASDPKGEILFLARPDATIAAVEWRTGKVVEELPACPVHAGAMAVSPDGRFVVIAGTPRKVPGGFPRGESPPAERPLARKGAQPSRTWDETTIDHRGLVAWDRQAKKYVVISAFLEDEMK